MTLQPQDTPAERSRAFIVRRNSGFGGAERVAERIARRFEALYPTARLWAGETYRGRTIPGRRGPPWWRSLRYTRHLDRMNLCCGKDTVVPADAASSGAVDCNSKAWSSSTPLTTSRTSETPISARNKAARHRL